MGLWRSGGDSHAQEAKRHIVLNVVPGGLGINRFRCVNADPGVYRRSWSDGRGFMTRGVVPEESIARKRSPKSRKS